MIWFAPFLSFFVFFFKPPIFGAYSNCIFRRKIAVCTLLGFKKPDFWRFSRFGMCKNAQIPPANPGFAWALWNSDTDSSAFWILRNARTFFSQTASDFDLVKKTRNNLQIRAYTDFSFQNIVFIPENNYLWTFGHQKIKDENFSKTQLPDFESLVSVISRMAPLRPQIMQIPPFSGWNSDYYSCGFFTYKNASPAVFFFTHEIQFWPTEV